MIGPFQDGFKSIVWLFLVTFYRARELMACFFPAILNKR